jgi:hypothetical protein
VKALLKESTPSSSICFPTLPLPNRSCSSPTAADRRWPLASRSSPLPNRSSSSSHRRSKQLLASRVESAAASRSNGSRWRRHVSSCVGMWLTDTTTSSVTPGTGSPAFQCRRRPSSTCTPQIGGGLQLKMKTPYSVFSRPFSFFTGNTETGPKTGGGSPGPGPETG